MTQQTALMKTTPREKWSNLDWANHLGCPITEMPSIIKFMQENYSSLITLDKATGRFCVRVYRHEITPSESIRPIQIYASELHEKDFIREANRKISALELSDFWAKMLEVPKRSLQMMLIR
jgi:hypothetical protein